MVSISPSPWQRPGEEPTGVPCVTTQGTTGDRVKCLQETGRRDCRRPGEKPTGVHCVDTQQAHLCVNTTDCVSNLHAQPAQGEPSWQAPKRFSPHGEPPSGSASTVQPGQPPSGTASTANTWRAACLCDMVSMPTWYAHIHTHTTTHSSTHTQGGVGQRRTGTSQTERGRMNAGPLDTPKARLLDTPQIGRGRGNQAPL